MKCNGNSAETCGGPDRLDLYSYGTANSTTTSPAVAGKRGLAYNSATYANLFKGNKQVTWGYNWGYPSNGLDSSFEFVRFATLAFKFLPFFFWFKNLCTKLS